MGVLRRSGSVLAAALAAVIASTGWAAAQSNWYTTGGAGALTRFDASRPITITSTTGASGPGTSTATFNPGPTIYLGAGYRLPLGFRIEGDFSYAHYVSDTISPLSTDGTFPRLNGERAGIAVGRHA
jgi:hypothetical protein